MLDFSSQFTIDFHTKSLIGKENNPGFNPFLLQQKTYLLCQNIRSVFRVLGIYNFVGGSLFRNETNVLLKFVFIFL